MLWVYGRTAISSYKKQIGHQMTNFKDMPGPGDEITWPSNYNHPNDPRTEEQEEDRDIDYEEEDEL